MISIDLCAMKMLPLAVERREQQAEPWRLDRAVARVREEPGYGE
jgi:hypothetical protein